MKKVVKLLSGNELCHSQLVRFRRVKLMSGGTYMDSLQAYAIELIVLKIILGYHQNLVRI